MRIKTVYIKGFRNYCDAVINFNETNLIIGANDVGKTNLLYAIRLLLDKSLSELDLEPKSNDFHVSSAGEQVENIEITIKFIDVSEDAVISKLGGYISDEGETYIKYLASSLTMDYKILISHEHNNFNEVSNRFYLKCLSLRYINSQRDLEKYIKIEKKHLLRLAQEVRSEKDTENDGVVFNELNKLLTDVNEKVKGISYVASATEELNEELRKLSYTHDRLTVQLDTGAIGIDQFIEKLELSANTNGKKLMLGGDGFNNQILLALWKAKSVREHDVESEVVIYCIEEPEAHLFPHQQRKLAAYLIDKLPGQAIVTSHSPQIAVNFQPDSIIKLYYEDGETLAASNGCSDCISSAWDGMGYRMSIIPAEAFFANVVFLVEGPSEVIFYTELAKALNIYLDYYNISILSVDGIQFEVYRKILTALNISWIVRTDNDASKVPRKDEWQYAGINRALALCGKNKEPNSSVPIDSKALHTKWGTISPIINPYGVYISFLDLEGDLTNDFSKHVLDYTGMDNQDDAADYLRGKKAIRMRELIKEKKDILIEVKDKDIARPLIHTLRIARGEL